MEEAESSASIDSFYDRYYPTNNSEEEEEEDEVDHRTKSRKHAPILEKGKDRISTLTDTILLSILSFLLTEDAIKTGVLSKRWAYLWTSVPSLSFELGDPHSGGYYSPHVAMDDSASEVDTMDDFARKRDTMDDFISAVDHTLLLHRAPKLTNFSVRFRYSTKLKADYLDRWVRFATTAKVSQLSLHLFVTHINDIGLGRYELPQHLYANEFVSEFNFSYCKIFPNGLLDWSSLKHLCIGQSALCEDVIREVLMGSPRLESLELHDCWEFKRLDIVSESLRKLVIDSYVINMLGGEVRELELEIVAPKIHSLEILGNFEKIKCRIKDVSALVEAKLDFDVRKSRNGYYEDDYRAYYYEDYYEEKEGYKEYQDIVRDILDSLHHVKKLTVGNWCLMIVSIMSVKHLPSPLPKCQCLTIVTSMEKWSLPGIGILLQSSPYVETLNIDFPLSFVWTPLAFLVRRYDEVDHWKSKEIYFKFLLRCLKFIKIKLFLFKEIHAKEFTFLVQFLLTDANVLEKMVITNFVHMRNISPNRLLKSLQVALMLLSFPRSSPHAVVMLPY
ncbi:putative F-box protein At1g49610 [Castanea sativa]|uniref:putative F-box protein At1g49610 n=1 Tax=Castanea sativa TaxID=21020 RepID=UPI003F653B7D